MPLLNPNNSVASAAPTAVTGSIFKPSINRGAKKTAPPIPLLMATVAIKIASGNKYHSAKENSIQENVGINYAEKTREALLVEKF